MTIFLRSFEENRFSKFCSICCVWVCCWNEFLLAMKWCNSSKTECETFEILEGEQHLYYYYFIMYDDYEKNKAMNRFLIAADWCTAIFLCTIFMIQTVCDQNLNSILSDATLCSHMKHMWSNQETIRLKWWKFIDSIGLLNDDRWFQSQHLIC